MQYRAVCTTPSTGADRSDERRGIRAGRYPTTGPPLESATAPHGKRIRETPCRPVSLVTGVTSSIAFAVGAGVATFFAPCAYALLPGYVGYYVAATGDERPSNAGVVARGLAATVGVIAVFAVAIAITVAVGQSLGAILPTVEAVVGVALIVLGAVVIVRGSLPLHVALPKRRSSVFGFVAFGAAYATAATACVFPLFLAIVLQSLSFGPGEAFLVVGGYAGAFATLMLAATVTTAMGHRLAAGRVAGGVDRFVRLSGVLIALAGVGQLYVAFG